jgi:hypothetical protein
MNRPLHVMQLIAGFAVEGPSGGIAQFGINLAQALDPQIIERTLCGLWDYKTESEKERIAVLRTKGMHVCGRRMGGSKTLPQLRSIPAGSG